MSERQFEDLTPYLTDWKRGDWFAPTSMYTCGFYVHRGHCYLQGMVVNPRASNITHPAVGTTILAGLPLEVRPGADVAVTVVTNLWISSNEPGFAMPRTIPATVTESGELLLSALPDYVNDIPPGEHLNLALPDPPASPIPDFTTALRLALIIGNVSWPIRDPGVIDDSDMVWESLGDYMTSSDDFENIDAEIAVHQTRVHLRGTIRAKRDNAVRISTGVAPVYRTGLAPDSPYYERSYTTAAGFGGAAGIEVDNDGSLYVINDELADTNTMPEPEPPWSTSFMRYPGLVTRGDRYVAVPQTRINWRDNEADPPQWDYGFGVGPCGEDAFAHDIFCPTLGIGESVTWLVDEILSCIFPLPDWFVISVVAVAGGPRYNIITKGVNSCAYDPETGAPAGCGPYHHPGALVLANDAESIYLVNLGEVSPVGSRSDDSSPDWADTAVYLVPGGMVARIHVDTGYAPAQSIPSGKLLWRRGELTRFTVQAEGQSNRGSVGMEIDFTPYWELRSVSIEKNDIITLDGAGWQAFLRGVAPGFATAKPGRSGTRKRTGRIIAGRASAVSADPGTTIPGGGTPNTANVLSGKNGGLDSKPGRSGIART